MKTLRIFLTVSAASLIAIACTKNQDAPAVTKAGTLFASTENESKTYLTSDDDKLFSVLWNGYDEIATLQSGNRGVYAAPETAEGKSSTGFTIKEGYQPVVAGDFTAYSPASFVVSATEFEWPANQPYITGQPVNAPMISKGEADEDGNARIVFNNLGGVLRFTLRTNNVDEFKIGMAVVSADQPLSGKCEIHEIGGKSYASILNSVKSGSIVSICDEPVTISKTDSASFYFAIPEGSYTGLSLTFCGTDGKVIAAKLKAGTKFDIVRSRVTKLRASVDPKDSEGSNCFIYDGTAPIVITKMGNAFDGTTALDGNNEKAKWVPLLSHNAKGCKIVWETGNTSTKPADGTIIKSVNYANGVLVVNPTGTPGNALVAVTSDNDGAGDILWSYHIWVPETEIGRVVVRNTSGEFVFLDRNIGALENANENVDKSLGMLYQWGRKDPLLGFCNFTENTFMNSISLTKYDNDNTTDDSKILEYSMKNPSTFIVSHSSNLGFWRKNHSHVYLWGYGAQSTLTAAASQSNKTIYDPCPAGYRVASNTDFLNAFGSNRNISVEGNKWSNNGLYFPKSGTIDYGGTTHNGGTDYYSNSIWSAVKRKTSSSTSINLCAFTSYYRFGKGSNGADGQDGLEAGQACNVRCIKDTQAASSEGYTLTEIGHEYINFFE